MKRLTDADIKNRILEVLSSRDAGKTMCPSEVLPTSERKNKEKMEDVRKVAFKMAKNHEIEIVQKGQKIDLNNWKGPLRLRLPK